jgi:hypothetical protein
VARYKFQWSNIPEAVLKALTAAEGASGLAVIEQVGEPVQETSDAQPARRACHDLSVPTPFATGCRSAFALAPPLRGSSRVCPWRLGACRWWGRRAEYPRAVRKNPLVMFPLRRQRCSS